MPVFLKALTNVLQHWFDYYIRFRANKVRYLRYLGARIGDGCYIYNSINGFSDPWLVEIGDNVTITGGVLLLTHDGGTRLFRREVPGMNPVFGNSFDTIRIKDNSFIGVNSLILPGVVIGPNSVVGAGSVVTRDVPPGMVYAGNPAHEICSIDIYKENSIKKMIPVKSITRKELRKELSVLFWHEER